jgi:hypothetical protein
MSDDLLHVAAQLEAGLTDEVKRDLMQRVVVVTERQILAEMPERTGKLKASVTNRYDAQGGEILIGADYALFVHEPTKPHVIRGNPVLAFAHGGTTVFARYVNHPGTKGNPFIDRGLDKAGNDIDAALLAAGDDLLRSLA